MPSPLCRYDVNRQDPGNNSVIPIVCTPVLSVVSRSDMSLHGRTTTLMVRPARRGGCPSWHVIASAMRVMENAMRAMRPNASSVVLGVVLVLVLQQRSCLHHCSVITPSFNGSTPLLCVLLSIRLCKCDDLFVMSVLLLLLLLLLLCSV